MTIVSGRRKREPLADSSLSVLSGRTPGDYPARRVAMAMSGGVDSSLAAALLVESGFEVIGLTMSLWDYSGCGRGDGERGCCDSSAVNDARRAADAIGIPHYTVDLRERFERAVIDDFTRNYLAGRTPNPCVRCNTLVKWGAFREKALVLGCGLVATGHYARIGAHADGTFSLLTGADPSKDQSYFLWGLGSDDLAATLFPLGSMTKTDTRAEAEKRKLPTAHRTESQEICFITDDDYGRFLRHRLAGETPIPLTPGNILDTTGKIIGEHRGAAYYTVGQRKGLGIALGHPAYVVEIDADANTVTVGEREDLLAGAMRIGETRWTRGFPPGGDFTCTVRVRYRSRGTRARVSIVPDGAMVTFDAPQNAVTPGQSAVFSDGELILGGGVIERAIPK